MTKKILLATLISEDYFWCLNTFLPFLRRELDIWHGNMQAVIVVNSSSKEFVKDMTNFGNNNPEVTVLYSGEFRDKRCTKCSNFNHEGVCPAPVLVYKANEETGELIQVPADRKREEGSDAIVASRNAAINFAREKGFDILFFVDVDEIPDELCSRKLFGYFNMPTIGAVGGTFHIRRGVFKYTLPRIALGVPVRVSEKDLSNEKLMLGLASKDIQFLPVLGLPFGLTMIRREVFEKQLVDRDFGKYGTEDYKYFDTMRETGLKAVWVKEARARHLRWNKELDRIEAW